MQNVKSVLRRKKGVIAGVAAGLADFFGLDVSLVRLMLIVSALLGGSGFMLYIALWVVMPKEGWILEPEPVPAT